LPVGSAYPYKLVPFELNPIFKEGFNPAVLCDDCGKTVECRRARVVMTDISESPKDQAAGNPSIDELFRNMVRTILCEECLRRQYPINPETEFIQ
jgi:hypothetical protein